MVSGAGVLASYILTFKMFTRWRNINDMNKYFITATNKTPLPTSNKDIKMKCYNRLKETVIDAIIIKYIQLKVSNYSNPSSWAWCNYGNNICNYGNNICNYGNNICNYGNNICEAYIAKTVSI